MSLAPNDNNFEAISYLNRPPSRAITSLITLVKLLTFSPLVTHSNEIKIDKQV